MRTAPWAGRNFFLLVSSTAVNTFGNAAGQVAEVFAVLKAGGSATDAGLVVGSHVLAMVLFLLIGGVIADRLPRNRVMVAANLASACVLAGFGTLVLSGHPQLWPMMALAALAGTAQAFFAPASEGMLLQTVDHAHTGQAFSVYRIGVSSSQILGAAAGGVLVDLVGPGWVLILDAMGFLVAAGLRLLIRVDDQAQEAGGGLLDELREGWGEFRSRRWLWSIVAQFSLVVAGIAAVFSVLGPVTANNHLGGAEQWGLITAFEGVGLLAGGLLMLRLRPDRLLRTATLAMVPAALPAAALAVLPPLPLICAAMFLAGVGFEIFGVCWMTTMKQEIPEEKFSRVASYDWFGSIGLAPLGTAAAGPLYGALGGSGALWVAFALTLVPTLVVLLVPEVREMRRKPTDLPIPKPQQDPASPTTA